MRRPPPCTIRISKATGNPTVGWVGDEMIPHPAIAAIEGVITEVFSYARSRKVDEECLTTMLALMVDALMIRMAQQGHLEWDERHSEWVFKTRGTAVLGLFACAKPL